MLREKFLQEMRADQTEFETLLQDLSAEVRQRNCRGRRSLTMRACLSYLPRPHHYPWCAS